MSMIEIGAFEAKNKLSELLTRAENGEEVIITRRGKRVARLVAITVLENDQKMSAQEAADEIRRMRKGMSLGGIPIKALIEDGRK
jgi:prevent-host-death family protein